MTLARNREHDAETLREWRQKQRSTCPRLASACPICHALPGRACTSPTGALTRPHGERVTK